MNLDLPEIAAEFGAAADKAVSAAGGTEMARRAEAAPAERARAEAVLTSLGAGDLDPRSDLDAAAAAGELCRVAGRYSLPWPVAGWLLRDEAGRPAAAVPAASVGEGRAHVDHGDLFAEWILWSLDGTVNRGRPVGEPLRSKLGPFVTGVEASPGTSGGDDQLALLLTLGAWRVLGAVERSVELAVDHVRDRVQFGQPLSSFQAVQFQLADAAVWRDGLSELCRFTLWRVLTAGAGIRSDAWALRVHALDAGRAVLRTCQQLFGASGVCDEYDISILVRHTQPELRLPVGAERSAEELFRCVQESGFDALFRQGGPA